LYNDQLNTQVFNLFIYLLLPYINNKFDYPFLKARIIAAVKNIDALMLTRVWQVLEYRIDVCRVTRGAHIEHL
jgi:hypothetical protein